MKKDSTQNRLAKHMFGELAIVYLHIFYSNITVFVPIV